MNAASGRAVLRWFARERRGFAMGLRQTSVPLGAAAAAILLPALGNGLGVGVGFRILAAVCLVAAVSSWMWVREPPSAARPTHAVHAGREGAPSLDAELPDRRRSFRAVVAAGCALVICQAIFVSFVVEMLHGHRDLSLRHASLVFAAAQVAGALARVGVGIWSDRMPDRLGPLRVLAFAMAVGGLALAASVDGPMPLLVLLCVVVGALVTCWNGLAFTAAGELAAPSRTGTALGLQSTANFFVASITPFLIGTLIAASGFTVGFGLIALPATVAGALLLRLHSQRNQFNSATAKEPSR